MKCSTRNTFASVVMAGLVGAALIAAPKASSHECAGVVQAAAYTVPLGLAGYSPVSYIENNRAEPGSPLFSLEHEGVTYFFVSPNQMKAFRADPDRYLPAYGGYCAFGCSLDSKFVPDPTSFRVINGRTHLFLKSAEVDAVTLWNEADPAEVRAKADAFWTKQSGR